MIAVDIVLPAYNEEKVLPEFNAALFRMLESLSSRYRFRVIYVLDRSTDKSFEVLRQFASEHSNLMILHLSRRFGHQMSLVAGLDQCDSDAVIMMDCDLQHPVDLIPLLLEKFELGYEIVHAIRRYDRSTPMLKQWSSRIFYLLQNLLSPVSIPEGAADFRLISRRVAEVFRSGIREQNQFLRGLFQWVGFRSTQVFFSSAPRRAGHTKYSLRRLLAFTSAGITSFSKVPLRLASLTGFLLSALSLAYGIHLLTVYFTQGHLPRGYTSMILMVTFLGGLQLTVLGILGEYMGSVFDEVKRRPLYLVDEIVGPRSCSAGSNHSERRT